MSKKRLKNPGLDGVDLENTLRGKEVQHVPTVWCEISLKVTTYFTLYKRNFLSVSPTRALLVTLL